MGRLYWPTRHHLGVYSCCGQQLIIGTYGVLYQGKVVLSRRLFHSWHSTLGNLLAKLCQECMWQGGKVQALSLCQMWLVMSANRIEEFCLSLSGHHTPPQLPQEGIAHTCLVVCRLDLAACGSLQMALPSVLPGMRAAPNLQMSR